MPIEASRCLEIQDLLSQIERDKNVTIIHAVESGSRAWGFPSVDSDYDVRFIYFHERDWYITPFNRKDTIEVAISNDLDAGGWDIGKCLSLLYKGNAVLQEWLNSPVVYKTNTEKTSTLRNFAVQEFNPAAAFYHYISLAKRKFLDEATETNAKYFLYGMRAVLCAKFIADCRQVPPVNFHELIAQYVPASSRQELDYLIKAKASGNEKDCSQISAGLWGYGIVEFNELKQVGQLGQPQSSPEAYSLLMRSLIL